MFAPIPETRLTTRQDAQELAIDHALTDPVHLFKPRRDGTDYTVVVRDDRGRVVGYL